MTNASGLKSAFWHSIKLGTGRAYLLARANPKVDFSAFIIRGALKNFAYDGQAESNRAHYLYGLYALSTQQARIRRAVLAGLAKEQDDTWSLTQLFALALRFAQDGDAAARRALYRRFLTRPIRGSDWAGAQELMQLDGLDGLTYIARKFGRKLAKNPRDWQDDHLIQSFQEKHPDIDAWEALRLLAEQDADVRRYLQAIAATLAKQAARQRPASIGEPDLMEMLGKPRKVNRSFLRSSLRRRTIEHSELARIANRLLTEKSKDVQENLLHLFACVKFPLDYQVILAFARQKPTGENRIVEFALEALTHFNAPEIRAFALQKLLSTTRPAQYTDILLSNYQAGDAALLTALVGRIHQEHRIEQLACSYTEIYQANKTPECAAPLLALYQKMTCGIHRNMVIELLIENNVLPDWLNEELPFDSYAKTRLLQRPD